MESKARYLEGKVALVTGSSRGIGRAIATHLASLGAAVAVHGSSPTSARAFNEADSLAAVAAAITAETGSEALPVHGDIREDAIVRTIVQNVRERFGRIDILVNAAGGDIGAAGTGGPGAGKPQPNDAVFIPLADVQAEMDRNLMSCINTCRAVVPEMMDRRAGRVVNISSVDGSVGQETSVIYAVAKAGVTHYTRCLAAELRQYNVTANAIAPGNIVTPRFAATRPLDDAMLVEGGTLMRYGRPIEVARVVEFFCSPLSDFVTGQLLRVDGGRHLWPA